VIIGGDDVAGGQPHDPAQGLGIEQCEDGGDAGAQGRSVVGEQPAQQAEPMVLGDRRLLRGLVAGDVEAGHPVAAHRPLQERA